MGTCTPVWVKHVACMPVRHYRRACVHACAPTTVAEGLQQLLLGQALIHLHPHHVTAEPLRLLLRLREPTEARRVKEQRVRREHVVMETKENVVLLLHRERRQEKVNEERAFPNAGLSAAIFQGLYSHFQL